ncbi:MAG: YbaN family protein [Candidatus Methanomethylophilaceae archaeon]
MEDGIEGNAQNGLSGLKLVALECFGAVMLAIGAIGIVLPLIPTTPFVIVAAFCFAGNPRIYRKIVNSPFFGDYVRAWKEKRTIPMRTRLQGIAMVWIVLIITMAFFMTADWQRILLLVVGMCVTVHLLTVFRKVRSKD